ncbi:hypothetical protein [Escherichia coli]|uniref:hypothetical protein n=1 Tax=Escherichia coli TaxID=562 RepID=UPI0037727104
MKRRNFSPEFKRESAQFVTDQKYREADTVKAIDVGLSKANNCVMSARTNKNT